LPDGAPRLVYADWDFAPIASCPHLTELGSWPSRPGTTRCPTTWNLPSESW